MLYVHAIDPPPHVSNHARTHARTHVYTHVRTQILQHRDKTVEIAQFWAILVFRDVFRNSMFTILLLSTTYRMCVRL